MCKWLVFQGFSFKGRDESETSINYGNFLKFLSSISSYNDKVANVLENAPQNALYRSPKIEKEILHVIAKK